MFHVKKAALLGSALPIGVLLEKKDADAAELVKEVNKAIDKIGKDFEEFKSANDARLKELGKKGAADTLLEEKVTKIGNALDKFVESKAALEKRIDAEKKEREELELRLSRPGNGTADQQKAAENLKSFNDALGGIAAERRLSFQPLDQKGYDDYRNGLKSWLRHGPEAAGFDKKTMSVGSDPDGGYFVTPDIGGRIVTKVYETSEIRGIASAQTIGTDALEGIEDLDEAGAGYAGEQSQGTDTRTPQVGKWRIPVFWLDTEPKATQQLLDDANVDIEAWLAGKVADKLARFENKEFCTGNSNRIRGITSYPVVADTGDGVAWGSIGIIGTGQAGDFPAATPADKLFDIVGLVKNAYLSNARWLTRRSVITKIRKFKESTTNGYIWQPGLQLGQPERLLQYEVTRAEDMPAVANGSLSLGFGDFRTGYQIVDRAGIRVLRDPYTAKPFVKFYTTKRTGGAVVNFESFKLMQFS